MTDRRTDSDHLSPTEGHVGGEVNNNVAFAHSYHVGKSCSKVG